MATTNAMFTITDTGDLSGRNLALDSGSERSGTVPSSYDYAYISVYNISEFGKVFAHTQNQELTISCEYEVTGNSLDTAYIYFQLNGSQTQPANSRNVFDNPTGVYQGTFKVTSSQANSTSSVVRPRLMKASIGATISVKNVKLEVGKAATDWTPAPEDVVTADTKASTALETATEAVTAINNYIAGKEIVVGTQTEATNLWTGRAGFSELVNGQEIAYWLPYAGLSSTAVTLTLTLANNSVTDAIPVYYKGTTRATTHFTAGTVVHLTYRENADVAGTTVANGWWADASYDSGNTNYYDRIRLNNAIKAKTAISASRFIVSDDSGYFHLAGGSVFDITKPILWCSTAISAGATGNNNYISLPSLTLRNNASGITLTANKTCYLVGTLAGKMFTVKSSGFFTATVPTSDDGYYYISLGYLYSTYQIYLYPEHPIYKFVNGSFKSLNQVAYEASVTAESKNSVYYQTSAPTGKKVGDTWFDTNDGNKIYRWNGSSWVAAELGDSAVANLSASKLIAGSVMGNVILGGTIQAGGSDVGQDGKVLVKDVDDVEVASLSKDGLIATAGNIGGWDISSDGLVRTSVQDNVTKSSVYGCWSNAEVNGGCELRILQKDPDDSTHVLSDKYIRMGVASDEYVHVYEEVYDPYTQLNNRYYMQISGEKIYALHEKYDHAQNAVTYAGWTEYGPWGPRTYDNDEHPGLEKGITYWSVLSPTRTVKGTLKVTIYQCGNLFWAHFSGSIPAGWNGTQNAYLPIVSDDNSDRTHSKLCAPPERIEKYIQPQNPSNARPIIRVNANGTIGLYSIIKSVDNTNWTTVADNMETCDIFWARIG